MFAAFPSTNMKTACGRLHNNGAGAFGAGFIVVESILVDWKPANILPLHLLQVPMPKSSSTKDRGSFHLLTSGIA